MSDFAGLAKSCLRLGAIFLLIAALPLAAVAQENEGAIVATNDESQALKEGSEVKEGSEGIDSAETRLSIFQHDNKMSKKVNGVADQVDSVSSKLGRHDSGIRSELDELSSKVDFGRPRLRDSHRRVRWVDLDALFDVIKPEIKGVLATFSTLREGFEGWDPDPFKAELSGLIDDMEEVYAFVDSLRCVDGQVLERRTLGTDLLRALLDRTPPINLYVLNRILDESPGMSRAPGASGWRFMFRDVLDVLEEQNLGEQFDDLCEQPAETVRGELHLRGDPPQCAVLRPPEVQLTLKAAQVSGKASEAYSKLLNAIYSKDDLQLTLEGVVGAGGGAGTSAPDPVKAVLILVAVILEKLGGDKAESAFENLFDIRDACLDVDADIEESLSECSPRLSYLLTTRGPDPRPNFLQVLDHVEREVNQVDRCIGLGGCADSALAQARMSLANATDKGQSLEGFRYLCEAHCRLIDRDGDCSFAGR